MQIELRAAESRKNRKKNSKLKDSEKETAKRLSKESAI